MSGAKNMEERHFFRKLTLLGRQKGIRVLVFTPEDIDEKNKRMYAHQYDPARKRWVRKWSAIPPVVYDRCRYEPTERYRRFRNFRDTYEDALFLNHPIPDKWNVLKLLAQNNAIRPHIPETWVYVEHRDLYEFLKKRTLVYLKPINGTGGRGILRLKRQRSGLFLIEGRDRRRRIIRPQIVPARLIPAKMSDWNLKNNYLIQRGIPSVLPDGRVFDFRLLIQKNGDGQWEVTGCAGRIGIARSITSNLHGGGEAAPMNALLKARFESDSLVESIRDKMFELAHEVAETLERHAGPLCELGLDIAVDPDGRPWLLELNPKPAREVFRRIGERETYMKAIGRPLEYALWLYRQKQPELSAAMR